MKPFEIALSEIGIQEIVGIVNNPEVLKYYKKVGHSWVKDDETAWCAAFTGYCLEVAGIPSTKKLNARSYLKWGTKTTVPKRGDIVVLWRISPTAAEGHVGFYVTQRNGMVYMLSGNQNNQVDISAYPLSRVLEYRTNPNL